MWAVAGRRQLYNVGLRQATGYGMFVVSGHITCYMTKVWVIFRRDPSSARFRHGVSQLLLAVEWARQTSCGMRL